MNTSIKLVIRKIWSVYKYILLAQLLRNLLKFVTPYLRAKYGYVFKNVKGEISHFFMGDLAKNWYRLYHFEADNLLKYPEADFVKQNNGPQVELIATSEAALHWILKDEFRVMAREGSTPEPIWKLIRVVFGNDGITFRDHTAGEKTRLGWLHRRNLIRRFLSPNNFRTHFVDIFNERAGTLVDILSASAQKGEHVDMYNMFSRYAVDSAQKIIFGKDTCSLENGLSENDTIFNEVFLAIVEVYQKAYYVPSMLATIIPYPFGNMFLRSVTNILPIFRKFRGSVRAVDAYVDEIIEAARKDLKEGKIKSLADESIVSCFLEDGAISDKILKNLVKELVFGGRDTTFGGLTWMIYELGRHPEVQQRLHEEVSKKMNGKDNPTYEDVSPENMPFLTAVIYEALRLHPPAPKFTRNPTKDITFYNGAEKIFIPKDTIFRCSVFTMLRNPKRYPNPLAFNPDRWLPWKEPSDFAFPIFSAGPRSCIGKQMYILEAKVVMCMIFRKLTFIPKDNKERYTPLSLLSTPSGNKEGTELDMPMKPVFVGI